MLKQWFSTLEQSATSAIEYTEQCADRAAAKAVDSLSVLPDSAYKRALEMLATFSVQRDH